MARQLLQADHSEQWFNYMWLFLWTIHPMNCMIKAKKQTLLYLLHNLSSRLTKSRTKCFTVVTHVTHSHLLTHLTH